MSHRLVDRRTTIVTPNARRRGDRAGDPLDGLVNLFDLGIVLAVAFLLAALSSLQLSDLLTSKDVTVVRKSGNSSTVIVKHGEHVRTIKLSSKRAVGQGQPIGTAYRLADGRVVIVGKRP
jgi:hypothetical protein